MDIVMSKGTEKGFWDFEDGEFRDITDGLGGRLFSIRI